MVHRRRYNHRHPTPIRNTRPLTTRAPAPLVRLLSALQRQRPDTASRQTGRASFRDGRPLRAYRPGLVPSICLKWRLRCDWS